jgi:hypothetical protein
MADRLSVSLQENLLVLLTFSAKAAPLIRNAVDANLFGNKIYREIISRLYEYLDKYKKPPGDHLPDLLEDLTGGSGPEAQQYADVLVAVGDQRDRGYNEDFGLAQLERFVRQQTLKSSVTAAAEAIQAGDLDAAQDAFEAGLKQRLTVFTPGSVISKGVQAAYNHTVRQDIISTGIRQLDDWDLGAARGEFHLFIAPPKAGKSWWLVHVTKRALIQRYKVVYITLELSENQIAQRLAQSLFSMTRRKAKVQVTRLQSDDLGRLVHFKHEEMTGRMSLDDASTRKHVEGRLLRMRADDNLFIKQFPAGRLTVRALDNYLTMLEQACDFVPDAVVVDYPDYMAIDPKNYRLEAGALFNDLRGVTVERNSSMWVASRSNREGAKAKMVVDTHAAEDYSRIYTADTVVTYSQTLQERPLGLARLFVSSTRVAERDRFVVLLSQAYPVGQFCLDSVMMDSKYSGLLEQAAAAMPQQGDSPEG